MEETFEVEVKVAIDSFEKMEQRILQLGAKKNNKELQIDSYYDHPCRTFQETDEALRVRSRQPLGVNEPSSSRGLVEFTYKGPIIDKTTKTRIEASTILDESQEISSILEHLDFKLVASVTKNRQFYSLSDITISIDEVEDVGLFMELEIIAKSKNVDQARNIIFALMEKMGLDPTRTIRASYLELYVKRKTY
ncbi:MAG: class IV adenylate cyclase [Candidatus Thorarchaeota archaeon]